jgi:Domain of unkown function (DUF1775)
VTAAATVPGVLRRTALVLVMAAAAAAVPSAAWAHGQLRPGRGAAGTTLDTVLVVPSEREGHGNSQIAVALPPGFTAAGCRPATGWTCAVTDKGVVWQRTSGSAAVEEFALTLRVGTERGTYLLPLSQRYDDGETRTFTDAPGSRGEGPVFTVSGAATTPGPTPTSGTGDGPDDPALAALPAGRRLEPASSDGGSALLVGLGVVGGTALLGTVLLLRRRRTDDVA